MGDVLGGATFVGLNLLVVLAPFLLLVWLGLRAVHALERSARAQQQIAQRMAELTSVLADAPQRSDESERSSSRS
jgi:hypothetical protein